MEDRTLASRSIGHIDSQTAGRKDFSSPGPENPKPETLSPEPWALNPKPCKENTSQAMSSNGDAKLSRLQSNAGRGGLVGLGFMQGLGFHDCCPATSSQSGIVQNLGPGARVCHPKKEIMKSTSTSPESQTHRPNNSKAPSKP